MRKSILAAFCVLIAICLLLAACGVTSEDDDVETTVYLKWSDGEEELHPSSISNYDGFIKMRFDDGSTMSTGAANVIIVKK